MIMMGLHFEDEVPFGKVNVHSIVLAEDGTKMSKSKGNTIDPLELFDQYGTDAVRFGLLYQSSTQDFAYSYERAEMGRAFVTKLWNAMRFVLAYPEAEESENSRLLTVGSSLSSTARSGSTTPFLEECEFSEAMRRIYSFAWNQFADWYIEIAKAAPSPATPRVLREVFRGILKLLHPVMPFATEEMASVMGERHCSRRSASPSTIPRSRTRRPTACSTAQGGQSPRCARSGPSRRSKASSKGSCRRASTRASSPRWPG